MDFELAVDSDCLTIIAEYLPWQSLGLLIQLTKNDKLNYCNLIYDSDKCIFKHPELIRKLIIGSLNEVDAEPWKLPFDAMTNLEHITLPKFDQPYLTDEQKRLMNAFKENKNATKTKSLEIDEIDVKKLQEILTYFPNLEYLEAEVHFHTAGQLLLPETPKSILDTTGLKNLKFLEINVLDHDTNWSISFPESLHQLSLAVNFIGANVLEMLKPAKLKVLELTQKSNRTVRFPIKSDAKIVRTTFFGSSDIELYLPKCELLTMNTTRGVKLTRIPERMTIDDFDPRIFTVRDDTAQFETGRLKAIWLLDTFKDDGVRFSKHVQVNFVPPNIVDYQTYLTLDRYEKIDKLININGGLLLREGIRTMHFISNIKFPGLEFDQVIMDEKITDINIEIRRCRTLFINNNYEGKTLTISYNRIDYIILNNFKGTLILKGSFAARITNNQIGKDPVSRLVANGRLDPDLNLLVDLRELVSFRTTREHPL